MPNTSNQNQSQNHLTTGGRKYPTTKTGAVMFLAKAKRYLEQESIILDWERAVDIKRDYNDRKAAQLLGVLSDLLLAEAQLDSWYVDLGFQGCQGDDNSIGGIPCVASEED